MIEASGNGYEDLLFNWLQRIIAETDISEMFFSKFSIKSLEDNSLVAEISGEPVSPEKGETVVKAVTYHKFQLEEKDGKYKATVSLDI